MKRLSDRPSIGMGGLLAGRVVFLYGGCSFAAWFILPLCFCIKSAAAVPGVDIWCWAT